MLLGVVDGKTLGLMSIWPRPISVAFQLLLHWVGFLVKVERTRHLDWRNTSWRSFANNFALYHNKSYELGKTDPPAAFNHYKKVNVLSHSVANPTSDILKPLVDSSCDLIIFFTI